MGKTEREDYIDGRIAQMKESLNRFTPQYKEIAKWIAPTRGRFLQEKKNRGVKQYPHILNGKAGRALRDATSGLFAGIMSPSTKWFVFEPTNKDLLEVGAVRNWAYKVEHLIRTALRESNLYSMAPTMISELLLFGTGAMSQVDDFEQVTRFYTHTIGSYLIGVNEKGDVDTFSVSKPYTVKHLVAEFELENLPEKIVTAYRNKKLDETYEVRWFVEPNPAFVEGRLGKDGKRYLSTWLLCGEILREEGFYEFPVYVPRWDVCDEEPWGVNCSGMVAISDVRSLQQLEKEKAFAMKRFNRPLLSGGPGIANIQPDTADGGIIVSDSDSPRDAIRAIYQVDPRISEMRNDIQIIERAIDEAFFVDLFRAISSMRGVQPRNQLELSQRNQEALLLLGPVLERVQRDVLARLLERTYKSLERRGLIPEAPQELQGAALEIRFISSLAQAQRAQDLSALQDYAIFAGQVAQAIPSAADKVDSDALLDQFVLFRGVTPTVNRDEKEVAEIRQAQAQMQQQQMQMQQLQATSSANVQEATAQRMMRETEKLG